MIPENIKVMNIAYRSKVMNVISKTQAEAKHIEYLDTFVNYLTAQVIVKFSFLRNHINYKVCKYK